MTASAWCLLVKGGEYRTHGVKLQASTKQVNQLCCRTSKTNSCKAAPCAQAHFYGQQLGPKGPAVYPLDEANLAKHFIG